MYPGVAGTADAAALEAAELTLVGVRVPPPGPNYMGLHPRTG